MPSGSAAGALRGALLGIGIFAIRGRIRLLMMRGMTVALPCHALHPDRPLSIASLTLGLRSSARSFRRHCLQTRHPHSFIPPIYPLPYQSPSVGSGSGCGNGGVAQSEQMACQCKGICSFMEPISRVNADSRESVHNGEVAFREVDELLGDRTQEMRIGPGEPAGTDHNMAAVA